MFSQSHVSICEPPFALEFSQSLGPLIRALLCCPLHEEPVSELWSRNLSWGQKNTWGMKRKPLLLVVPRHCCWAGVPRPGHLDIITLLGRPWPYVHSSPVYIHRCQPKGLVGSWLHPWCDSPQGCWKRPKFCCFTMIFTASISATANGSDIASSGHFVPSTLLVTPR